MNKLFIILFVISICLADFKIDFSTFQDGTTYMSTVGSKALFKQDKTEYSFSIDRYQSPSRIVNRGQFNSDTSFTDKLSWFYFAQDDNSIWREGIGIAYCPLSDSFVFPYKHKFSVAEVYDANRGVITSFRYKTQGYWNGLGFNVISFLLGYTYNIDYRFGYEVNPYLSIVYKGYYDEYTQINESSIGLELKI